MTSRLCQVMYLLNVLQSSVLSIQLMKPENCRQKQPQKVIKVAHFVFYCYPNFIFMLYTILFVLLLLTFSGLLFLEIDLVHVY